MANGHGYVNRRDFLRLALGIGGAAVGYKIFERDINRFLYSFGASGGSSGSKEPPVVGGNGSGEVTVAPAFDYYDEEFKVGINIQDGIEGNVTKMLKTMKERTPQFYNEVIDYLDGVRIVKSTALYYYNNYNAPYANEIGLAPVTIELGGSDDEYRQFAGIATLYTEARGIKAGKTGEDKQFKSIYEGELFQHSNMAKYRVAAGIDTKKEMNEWLESNGWFRVIEGRDPTPKETEGVDIEKYLIK